MLKDKVALVTGGSRGLGAATARALAGAGANVAITYVNSQAKAEAVVQDLEGRGVKAVAIRSDQADTSTAPQLIDDVVAHFGGLDILVNNAGVWDGSGPAIDDPAADTALLDQIHATNYLGVIAIIRAAAKVMRNDGRIINVGSGIGSRVGRTGMADYAASKAGLAGYTKGAARDLAPRRITVNLVAAGLMPTQEIPPHPEAIPAMTANLAIKRLGDPAETASVIAFLAGPDSTYITGAVIDANGGYTA